MNKVLNFFWKVIATMLGLVGVFAVVPGVLLCYAALSIMTIVEEREG